ncbi:MAG: phosphate-binding protein [Paenibacillus sp.]|nr:phosphate-binding protein [Paenibacillus sp.]
MNQSEAGKNTTRNKARIKLPDAALAAAGRGLLFFILYILFDLLLVMFAISGGGAIDRIFDHRSLNDYSLILLMALYAGLAALLFAGYGYAAAKKFPAAFGIHAVSVLSVVLAGFAIWFAIYTSVRGSTSDFGGVTWLPYLVYVIWAQPLFESLEAYTGGGSTMKYIALMATFWPGLSVLAGMGVYRAITGSPGRKMIKWGAVTAAGTWLILFAASLLWPNPALFTAAAYPKIDGATAAVPFGKILMRDLTGTNKPWAEKHVYFNTTHAAYENLIAKKADLIFVSGPSDEELKLAADNEVKLKLTPVGKDAFIFLVHKDNEVQSLTVRQIQDIYAGKINNWSEVGGQDHGIIAFQREKNSGSQTFMEQKVMKGIQLAEPPMEKKSSGMGGLIDAVADYKNGVHSIGYSFYYFANDMHKRESVKFLSVEGVESNKENIRSGTYPYTALLYAVTREGEPADGPAGKLLQWLKSEQGSRAIERGGFIPVSSGPQ